MKDRKKDKKQAIQEPVSTAVEEVYSPAETVAEVLNELLAAAKDGGIEYNSIVEKLVPIEAGAGDMDYALEFFEKNGVEIGRAHV